MIWLLGEAAAESSESTKLLLALGIFVAVGALVFFWWGPFRRLVGRQEAYYDRVLRGSLLIDVSPRTVTLLQAAVMGLLGLIAYAMVSHVLAGIIGAAVGAIIPRIVLVMLRRRRLRKLEDQLADGIQTLTSGVRAGLNLIQAMELLAKNGIRPISEEFGHMLREYEHGMSLERAMANAGDRIGSGNYRLLISALLTHRERGGNLGETLDRIAESIREIHRLEKQIETLTAPGRAAARWMGLMPAAVIGVLYLIDAHDTEMLFTDDRGRLILLIILVMNLAGFLWIRRIVNIDI